MCPIGELENRLEADALFARISLARSLGTPARSTERLNVFSGEALLVAFDLDMFGRDGDGHCWRLALCILVVVGVLNDFHQEPRTVRVQVG